ncbi:MAG: site-specific integrase [Hyphomicrobiaceae bacterium]
MANHTILGGKVHVYKRGRSRYWQCSTYIAGKNRRVSTKQESLAHAKDFAEDWYLELRGKNNRGELKAEKTFKQAAEQFLREYEVITEGLRHPGYIEGHERRLNLHLIPFLGDKGLSEITPGTVQEYRIFRLDPNNKPIGKPFKQAVRQFEKEYGFRSNHRTDREAEVRLETVKKHIVPFFGDTVASDITPDAIDKYREHRIAQLDQDAATAATIVDRELGALGEMLNWMKQRSRPPSKSTMHHEIVTLRQVTKTAIRHRWLDHLPDFSPPYRKAEKISHRAWFSPEEYKTLYEASRARARKNKGNGREWACEQLHDYILFMANTGLRPDEANTLEFRDVEIVEDEATEETILLLSVRGKRGVGYCKSMTGAVRPFERLRDRLRPESADEVDMDDVDGPAPPEKRRWRLPGPTDLVFPANHKKQFNAILEENGLKLDREGNRRTAYSLRHTYICLRLLEGADIYQIAKNCRTSVEMIEKFYAAHIATTLDASAINVRRRRKPKQETDDGRPTP